jgi:hypothetical protein
MSYRFRKGEQVFGAGSGYSLAEYQFIGYMKDKASYGEDGKVLDGVVVDRRGPIHVSTEHLSSFGKIQHDKRHAK